MKRLNYKLLSLILLFISLNSFAQVGIGTTTPEASAMLEIQSTTKGILIPRMTTVQRVAISSPAIGLMVFDSTTQSFWFYTRSWEELTGGSASDKIADTDGDTKVEVEKTSNEDIIRFSTAGTEYMQIGANGEIKLGNRATSTETPTKTNYTKITSDGSLSYVGDATRWEDLTVPVTSLKDKGDKLPDWRAYKGQLNTFWFNQSIEQELFFTIQMPHGWLEGSNLKPHVHWVAESSGSGLVGWGLEYMWTNVGDTFPTSSTIIYGEAIPAGLGGDTSVIADKHYITPLTEISGAGKTLSSMLICRIFRDADGTGTIDSYNQEAGMLQFDFHYQRDSDGSNSEYGKVE